MIHLPFNRTEPLPVIRQRCDANDREYQKKARTAFESISRRSSASRTFEDATGVGTGPMHALACNGVARGTLRNALIDEMLAFEIARPDLEFRLGTLFHSPWRSDLFSDSTIQLHDLARRTRGVIDQCGFEGVIAILEIQVAQDPIDRALWIFPHAHWICVTAAGFHPKLVAKRINDSARVSCISGAKCLDISNRLESRADIARAAGYIPKEPFSGKDFNPRNGKPDRRKRVMTPDRCLRMTEILSCLDFHDLIFSSGLLAPVRPKLFARLGARSDVIAATRSMSVEVQALWTSMREKLHGTEVTVNRAAMTKSENDPEASAMAIEKERRHLGLSVNVSGGPASSMSQRRTTQNPLIDASVMLSVADSSQIEQIGFPTFRVAFSGREDGIMKGVLEAYDRQRAADGVTFEQVRIADIRSARRTVQSTKGVYRGIFGTGCDQIARLFIERRAMRIARQQIRAAAWQGVRVGELRHHAWSIPWSGELPELTRIRAHASDVLGRFGFGGAWSAIGFRFAETTEKQLLLVPSVRYLGWGGSASAVDAAMSEIRDSRMIVSPDDVAEVPVISALIDEEETMFRAISFVLEQRFIVPGQSDGLRVMPVPWGEGFGRQYKRQRDIKTVEVSRESLIALGDALLRHPIDDLVWGNGTGRDAIAEALQSARDRINRWLRDVGRRK